MVSSTDTKPITFIEGRAVHFSETTRHVEPSEPAGIELVGDRFSVLKDGREHSGVLLNPNGAVCAIRRCDHAQPAALLIIGKKLLLVTGRQSRARRQDPDLQEVHGFLVGSVILAVGYASSSAHPLDFSRLDNGSVAHAVLVAQSALEHVSDNLHVPVTVRWEASAWCHAIVIEYAQRSEAHEPRVVIVREGEGVLGVKPPVIRVAPILRFPYRQHVGFSRFANRAHAQLEHCINAEEACIQ